MPNDSLDDWIDAACETEQPPIDEDEEPVGPPLTDAELDAGLRVLVEWQSSQDFSTATQALCRRCQSSDYFNRPKLKFLHDAYVIAEFANLLDTHGVRLADPSDQWPDGFVRLQDRIYNIEVTSTHGGRRLGEEYRTVSGPTLDPIENWIARADSIPKWLDEAIGDKSKKNYGSPCWLVVYLNISEYGVRQIETEQVIAATKARYSQAFQVISVLWKGKLY
jgi:hypothetical protein